MRLFDLSGRVAIVTGGNGGIGLGMARGLAAAGAAVVVAARNREKSEAAVASLAASGAASAFIPFDAADPGSCRDMVRQARERFGRLDILVNNAGMSIRPSSPATRLAMAATASLSVTSAITAIALAPPCSSSATASADLASLRPTTAIAAPACASPRAMPSPMPPLPPVTTATLPVRSNGFVFMVVLPP